MSLSLRSRTAPLGENFSSTLHPHSSLMLTPSLAYVSLIGSPFKLRILTCTQRVPSRRRVTFIVNKDSLRRFPTPGLPPLAPPASGCYQPSWPGLPPCLSRHWHTLGLNSRAYAPYAIQEQSHNVTTASPPGHPVCCNGHFTRESSPTPLAYPC